MFDVHACFSMNQNKHRKRGNVSKEESDSSKKKPKMESINLNEVFTQFADLHGQLHLFSLQLASLVNPNWNLKMFQREDNLTMRRCKIIQRTGGGPTLQPPSEILLSECAEQPTTLGTQTISIFERLGAVMGEDCEKPSLVKKKVKNQEKEAAGCDLLAKMKEYEGDGSSHNDLPPPHPSAELEEK